MIEEGYLNMGVPFYLTSTMEFEAENLIMHYTMKHGTYDEAYEDTDLGFKVTSTEKFKITYQRKGSHWIPTDSAEFKKLENVDL